MPRRKAQSVETRIEPEPATAVDDEILLEDEPDVVPSEEEVDMAVEEGAYIEEQEVAIVPPKRQNSRSKKVVMPEPPSDSSESEESEDVGRGRAQKGKGPDYERDHSSESLGEATPRRRKHHKRREESPSLEAPAPRVATGIPEGGTVGGETPPLTKRPKWMTALDVEIWEKLEGATKEIFWIQQKSAYHKEKCHELEATRCYMPAPGMYGSFMEGGVVSPPKKYDGGYDTQKLNDWITEIEISYEGKGYSREQWPP